MRRGDGTGTVVVEEGAGGGDREDLARRLEHAGRWCRQGWRVVLLRWSGQGAGGTVDSPGGSRVGELRLEPGPGALGRLRERLSLGPVAWYPPEAQVAGPPMAGLATGSTAHGEYPPTATNRQTGEEDPEEGPRWPAGAGVSEEAPPGAAALCPWLPSLEPVERTARAAGVPARAWWSVGGLPGCVGDLEVVPGLDLSQLLRHLGAVHRQVSWISHPLAGLPGPVPAVAEGPSSPPVHRGSRVLAVVPFHRCEPWLAQCLDSLRRQTRPPDGIVVLDDASEQSPVDIVRAFPRVTLLRSAEATQVGPYRLVQSVVEATRYDAYLFQDADDWSAADRLALLLAEAERTGAELVGSQELRVDAERGDRVEPVLYPLDVDRALADSPGHPLLHPTSLVGRRLLLSVGGFATVLRFGADTEFLLRAAYRGRIVNVPRFCYFRRHRLGSLTTDPETGLDSPARRALLEAVKERAYRNREAVRAGRPPDLEPLGRRPPVELVPVTGPPLLPAAG